MPALSLPHFTKYLLCALAVAVAAGMFFYLCHMQEALRTVRADVASAQMAIISLREANQQNLLQLAQLQKQQAEWDAEMLMAQHADGAQSPVAQQIDSAVTTSSPVQNAPAAPVLAATLSSLAHMQGVRP